MEMTITNTKENKLLSRKEITAHIKFSGKTPSYPEVTEALVAKAGASKEHIALQHVYTKFGAQEATVHARVYKTADDLKNFEPKVKEKKTATPAETK